MTALDLEISRFQRFTDGQHWICWVDEYAIEAVSCRPGKKGLKYKRTPALRVTVLGGKFGSQWVVPSVNILRSFQWMQGALWMAQRSLWCSSAPPPISQSSCLLYVRKNTRHLLNGEAGMGVNYSDPSTPAGTVNLSGGRSGLPALYGGESSQSWT